MTRTTAHKVSFVDYKGKMWTIEYVMFGRDEIEDITSVTVDGREFKTISYRKQNVIISAASAYGSDMIENAAMDYYEHRELKHNIDN